MSSSESQLSVNVNELNLSGLLASSCGSSPLALPIFAIIVSLSVTHQFNLLLFLLFLD